MWSSTQQYKCLNVKNEAWAIDSGAKSNDFFSSWINLQIIFMIVQMIFSWQSVKN